MYPQLGRVAVGLFALVGGVSAFGARALRDAFSRPFEVAELGRGARAASGQGP